MFSLWWWSDCLLGVIIDGANKWLDWDTISQATRWSPCIYCCSNHCHLGWKTPSPLIILQLEKTKICFPGLRILLRNRECSALRVRTAHLSMSIEDAMYSKHWTSLMFTSGQRPISYQAFRSPLRPSRLWGPLRRLENNKIYWSWLLGIHKFAPLNVLKGIYYILSKKPTNLDTMYSIIYLQHIRALVLGTCERI